MTEQYKIRYSNEAISDLESIYSYIAVEQLEPASAANLIHTIRDSVRTLNIFPSRHPLMAFSPWKEAGMRYLIVKKHAVFYFVNEDTQTVTISRILSCKRNIPSILPEENTCLEATVAAKESDVFPNDPLVKKS
ncbi:MAG: type II toxin-antitoxin system RelE/ParE family toxin [Clostridia bacterium]|nr:type II toxin-antitoxin system RelE/ParE family toxin [Clostridia bacterium]